MEKPVKTILIADDEEDLLFLVETTLEDPRYRILSATNGTTALERIQQIHPDLVILDWMMPGLTGLEIIKRLRDDPATAAIPAVLLTANDSRENKAQAQTLGIAAYLVKPFSPLELLQKVRDALEE